MDLAAMRRASWLPSRTPGRPPASQRVLLGWGWVAVALLLGLYVAVLQHSVQRAELIRSGQLHASAKSPRHPSYYASISPRTARP
jgi:hypothetical protein